MAPCLLIWVAKDPMTNCLILFILTFVTDLYRFQIKDKDESILFTPSSSFDSYYRSSSFCRVLEKDREKERKTHKRKKKGLERNKERLIQRDR